jgi:regulator of protease activity HflC (stomatin/prohibitin superfamily)
MTDKLYKPISGYLALLVFLGLGILSYFIFVSGASKVLFITLIVITLILTLGFFFVDPNGSRVLTLFGKYLGTVKDNGFYWANPFFTKKAVSLRARNFESERVKVNDKRGNPVLISVIIVWRVKDAYKAVFDVDDYEHFVKLQSDAAVRNLAGQYAYDNFDDHHEITLRSGLDEINHSLEAALAERLEIAGLEVMEARIGYLAYAEEIASAMLKRQQAEAIVSARAKIVEGAVGMVQMALDKLKADNIVDLDDDKKAAMVSNLLVVLCSDKETTPVVNAGTLHH